MTGSETFSVNLSPFLIGHFEEASLAKLHTSTSSVGKPGNGTGIPAMIP